MTKARKFSQIVADFALASVIGACGQQADRLSSPTPRLVDVWPEEGIAFVADSFHGTVVALRRVHNNREIKPNLISAQPVELVGVAAAPGRRSVARIVTDPARDSLWVLDDNSIYRHDMRTLALKETYSFGQQGYPRRLDDIVVDTDGSVFALSKNGAHIHRIDAAVKAVELWWKSGRAVTKMPGSRNTLLLSPGGEHLYLISYEMGELVRIDTRTKKYSQIRLTKPLWSACEVAVWDSHSGKIAAKQPALVLIGCLGGRQLRVKLSVDESPAAVEDVPVR